MKKLNKKGFTLIELLAVIVILAILIVLAVPAVLNIRKSSSEDLAKIAAASYLKSVQMCISAETTATSCENSSTIASYYDGTPESGTSVTISNDKVTNITFKDAKTGKTVTYSNANGITASELEESGTVN